MPKFLEKRLKKQYSGDIPYRIMNSLGYMRGNKETEKGARAEKLHKFHKHLRRKRKMEEENE